MFRLTLMNSSDGEPACFHARLVKAPSERGTLEEMMARECDGGGSVADSQAFGRVFCRQGPTVPPGSCQAPSGLRQKLLVSQNLEDSQRHAVRPTPA